MAFKLYTKITGLEWYLNVLISSTALHGGILMFEVDLDNKLDNFNS